MEHTLLRDHTISMTCGVQSRPGDDGWTVNADNGQRTAVCSCSLVISGPRAQVEPLVKLHLEG